MDRNDSLSEQFRAASIAAKEEKNTEHNSISTEPRQHPSHDAAESTTALPLQSVDDTEKEDIEIPVSAIDLNDEIKHRHTNSSKQIKRKTWQLMLFIALNVIVIAITSMIEFHGEDATPHSFSAFTSSLANNWYYLVIAVVCALGVYVFQSLKIMRMIKVTTGTSKAKPVTTSVILAKYYMNITPFSFIGKPFQVYYLRKNKVTVGAATAVPVVQGFLSTCAYLIMALIAFIFYNDVISSTFVKICAYVGVSITFIIPVSIILFSIMPRLVAKVVSFGVNLLNKLHIVRDPEVVTEKTISMINDFRSSLACLWKTKSTMLFAFLISFLEKLSEFSITYFVMLACGLNHGTYLEVTAITVFIYAATSVIPTPGKAGASEGTFYIVFESFYPMLVWRIISYYTYLFIGFIVVIRNMIRNNMKERARKDAIKENAKEKKKAIHKKAKTP
ncbi:MAG: flippase-like domain-containing protein [Clostridia bacterium]|nr:flippase-like domain-containing protein [Clostridia bacterium]